ncbi:MICOS complex subunit MIC13 homolog QIL1-like isoform X1 [Rhodnius prolixus]|uniref:MICOS complex subunit MIC13 homolog QIL1-like isoform X1 n=1 Tax=Rhodnius prolixus TaxID=13249 RepID=UPI003D1886AB
MNTAINLWSTGPWKKAWFGAKLGLVGGALYASAHYGIWKDSKRTEQIYQEMYHFVAPYIKEVPVEVPELPKASEITSASRDYWNHGVVATAKFLANLPDTTYSLAEKGVTYVMDQFSDPSGEQKQ